MKYGIKLLWCVAMFYGEALVCSEKNEPHKLPDREVTISLEELHEHLTNEGMYKGLPEKEQEHWRAREKMWCTRAENWIGSSVPGYPAKIKDCQDAKKFGREQVLIEMIKRASLPDQDE
jgi:hypothetical protein